MDPFNASQVSPLSLSQRFKLLKLIKEVHQPTPILSLQLLGVYSVYMKPDLVFEPSLKVLGFKKLFENLELKVLKFKRTRVKPIPHRTFKIYIMLEPRPKVLFFKKLHNTCTHLSGKSPCSLPSYPFTQEPLKVHT